MPDLNDFKITLEAARINSHLRQNEAAKALGVSPKTLSKWERGITFPDVQSIKKIECLYGIEYKNIIFLKSNNG